MRQKRNYYTSLISHIDESINEEYYLEAAWIYYANFEDRINSVLNKTGVIPLTNYGIQVSIKKRLEELIDRRKSNHLLRRAFFDEKIINDVNDRRLRRNPIMHSLMKTPKDIEALTTELKSLAIDSLPILKEFNSAAMRFRKKHIKKK